MGTLVDASVRSEQFALGDTFEWLHDAEFEALRTVSSEAGTVLPYLWAAAPDPRVLHPALVADSTTESVEFLSRDGGRNLYRIAWRPSVRGVIDTLVDEGGTLVGAHARNDQWTFKMLFPDHEAASSTYDRCRELGVDLSIGRVKCGIDAISPQGKGLSDKQFEALAVAFDQGYYAVPRRMTLKDLAKKVGVSHQALSERLRRGHQVVLSDLLGGDVSRPVEPVGALVGNGWS